MANEKREDNMNMVGKIYYAASSIICVPNSLADKGIARGAQACENMVRNFGSRGRVYKIQTCYSNPV